jgi:hypothetical protein
MKKIQLSALFILLLCIANAQVSDSLHTVVKTKKHHIHGGFHAEFGVGPAYGKIFLNNDVLVSKPGAGIEIKVGGALKENLILTFDILSKACIMPASEQEAYSPSEKLNDIIYGEVTYGAGLSYYIMPFDIVCSTTTGAGVFLATMDNEKTRTKFGFSGEVKVGKHWWLSNQWGILIGGTFGFTGVDNSAPSLSYYGEHVSSNRYTINVSISYH